MKVSVPAAAPVVPPETGASSIARPRPAAASASSRLVGTSMVELSMSSVPVAAWAKTPSARVRTSRTCEPAGSMVTTTVRARLRPRPTEAAACAAALGERRAGPVRQVEPGGRRARRARG